MLTLIVARARNGAIGLGNGLPWRLPEDLAYFKRTTMGATLVMGRRTWESLGRPLPGRRMVVLSRRPPGDRAGAAAMASTADSPLAAASAATAASASPADPAATADPAAAGPIEWATNLQAALDKHRSAGRELFVIGGADVYRQAMPLADRILITEIDAEPEADTFLEAPDPGQWEPVSREPFVCRDGTRLAWVDLRRRTGLGSPIENGKLPVT